MGNGSSSKPAPAVQEKSTIAPIALKPLRTQERQQYYANPDTVVDLQSPSFSDNWIGSYAVKPTISDNPSDIPGAYQASNQMYGVNNQWNETPAVKGTSLYDRLVTNPAAFAKSTLNPNPIKNPLLNPSPLKNPLLSPDPRKNPVLNPLSIFGI